MCLVSNDNGCRVRVHEHGAALMCLEYSSSRRDALLPQLLRLSATTRICTLCSKQWCVDEFGCRWRFRHKSLRCTRRVHPTHQAFQRAARERAKEPAKVPWRTSDAYLSELFCPQPHIRAHIRCIDTPQHSLLTIRERLQPDNLTVAVEMG